MPYIRQGQRVFIDDTLLRVDDIILDRGVTPGEMNYIISHICHTYLEAEGQNYSNLNQIIGVLECAKQEFYRRIAAPYEDKKIKENGDL